MLYEQQGRRYESGKATLFLAMAELGAGEDCAGPGAHGRSGRDLPPRRERRLRCALRSLSRASWRGGPAGSVSPIGPLRAPSDVLRRGEVRATGGGGGAPAGEPGDRPRRDRRGGRSSRARSPSDEAADSPWLLAQHDHLVGPHAHGGRQAGDRAPARAAGGRAHRAGPPPHLARRVPIELCGGQSAGVRRPCGSHPRIQGRRPGAGARGVRDRRASHGRAPSSISSPAAWVPPTGASTRERRSF